MLEHNRLPKSRQKQIAAVLTPNTGEKQETNNYGHTSPMALSVNIIVSRSGSHKPRSNYRPFVQSIYLSNTACLFTRLLPVGINDSDEQ